MPGVRPKTKPVVKRDIVTPLAVAGGAVAVGLGLWLFLGKKAFGAGDKIECTFKYKHAGPGGNFKFRVVVGHITGVCPACWFDEEENIPGYLQESTMPIEGSTQFAEKETVVVYEVPDIMHEDKYDLEASIRFMDGSIVPGMRIMADDIIVV